MILAAVFGVLSILYGAEGFPNGAPASESCNLMWPLHDNYPTPGDPPVSVEVDRFDFELGGTIDVTIISTKPFMGFLLQARTSFGNEIVGSYENVPLLTHTLNCTGVNDALTHSVHTEKQAVTVTWRAPKTDPGEDVTFLATVVERFDLWYHMLASYPVYPILPRTGKVKF